MLSWLHLFDRDRDLGISRTLRPLKRIVGELAMTERRYLVLTNLVADDPADTFDIDELLVRLHAHQLLRCDAAIPRSAEGGTEIKRIAVEVDALAARQRFANRAADPFSLFE